VSGLVRRGLVSVVTYSAMSVLCRVMSGEVVYRRDVIDDVWLFWGRVRRGRFSVGTCSTMSILCRNLFGDVG